MNQTVEYILALESALDRLARMRDHLAGAGEAHQADAVDADMRTLDHLRQISWRAAQTGTWWTWNGRAQNKKTVPRSGFKARPGRVAVPWFPGGHPSQHGLCGCTVQAPAFERRGEMSGPYILVFTGEKYPPSHRVSLSSCKSFFNTHLGEEIYAK